MEKNVIIIVNRVIKYTLIVVLEEEWGRGWS